MSDVKLIAATEDLEKHMAYCARVSNPSNQGNVETSNKLLRYCMREGHWSVFEIGNITMEINTTRDIARQILRHRSFTFQEFSQRYGVVLGFSEPTDPRLQDSKNRQSSLETDDLYLSQWWRGIQKRIITEADWAYQEALKKGIAKEVARKILPEGLTMSRMYVSGSPRSWIHYCQVRCDPATQKEHRDVAEKCREVLQSLLPSLEI